MFRFPKYIKENQGAANQDEAFFRDTLERTILTKQNVIDFEIYLI